MTRHIHPSNYPIQWWKWIRELRVYLSNLQLKQVKRGWRVEFRVVVDAGGRRRRSGRSKGRWRQLLQRYPQNRGGQRREWGRKEAKREVETLPSSVLYRCYGDLGAAGILSGGKRAGGRRENRGKKRESTEKRARLGLELMNKFFFNFI